MDPITQQVVLATAGAAGAGDATYVDDVFSTYLFDGTGSTQTITNGIDLSGEGGLVWIKRRSAADPHQIYDTERGANKLLRTTSTSEEVTSFSDLLTSFNSNGFSLGADSGGFGTNPSSSTMVSWTFRKAPGFFDVVTYTGNGSSQTIAHDLGSQPGFIMVKRYSSSEDWICYHRSLGQAKGLQLNGTNAEIPSIYFWNNTQPTSTHFSVGSHGRTNSSGETYVAYIFAHDDQSFGTDSDEAIIKCGSYTGNGQVSGTAVNLGFEPQWVMIKASSAGGNWVMQNTMTGMSFNSSGNGETVGNAVSANTTDAESGFSPNILATSTGFKALNTSSYTNSNGSTYMYMAIRRPNKPPEAATDVFKAVQTTSQPISVGFPTDLHISAETNSGGARYLVPRLTNGYLNSNSTATESAGSAYFKFDLQDSFSTGSFYGSAQTINWQFRRAPSFFDVVAYEGTSQNRTINHNLGATPELMIVKGRDYGDSWQVYNKVSGATKFNTLRQYGDQTGSERWNDTEPTSTVFTVGTDNGVNNSGYDYIAYLFASLNGISKVGSYTGTGSAINVDCGFTAGARFVLIKRIDGGINISADWYVWDSTRGIVSGNDPYLLLNTSAAQVTNTDYVDPLNAGFTVTSSAPAALNTSGGTYLFLAIA